MPIHNSAIALIKWTGKKRLQADRIVAHFPSEIETCHEPFLDDGAIPGRLCGNAMRVGHYESVAEIFNPERLSPE
jgi:site-specific DNA-adenine methylase